MKSIFRYPGGKTKKAPLDWIMSYRPEVVDEYREPCVGGGGVFWAMQGKRWINDKHPGLIAVYRALKDDPEGFIEECRAIRPALGGERTTAVGPRGGKPKNARFQKLFNQFKEYDGPHQALRYFFLNRTGHAGRVRYDVQSRLYMSKPEGWNIVWKQGVLEAAGEHMQGVRVTCGDYSKLLRAPGENVWVYMDPPYAVNTEMPENDKQYQHNFNEDDHVRLRDEIAACPHRVLLSYDDHPLIRDLYADFEIRTNTWTYGGTTLCQKKTGQELLILNY